MTAGPKVTVAMPVYNGSKTLGRAITSILTQSYDDFELLVIDDGSSDNSVNVIKSFDDRRLRLIVHESNQGLAGTRNHLLEESRGEYTAWLDQDDWAHPERLCLQVRALDKTPSAVICGTWVDWITENKRSALQRSLDQIANRGPNRPRDLKATLPLRNVYATSSVTLKTKTILEAGLKFEEAYAPAEDYKMWAQASLYGDLLMVPRALTKIYSYATGASAQSQERQIAGARRTRLELLTDLGFQLSPEDAEIHSFLCDSVHFGVSVGPKTCARDFTRASDWLESLQKRNAELNALDRRALRSACAERYLALLGACFVSRPPETLSLLRRSQTARAVPGVSMRRLIDACVPIG